MPAFFMHLEMHKSCIVYGGIALSIEDPETWRTAFNSELFHATI